MIMLLKNGKLNYVYELCLKASSRLKDYLAHLYFIDHQLIFFFKKTLLLPVYHINQLSNQRTQPDTCSQPTNMSSAQTKT